MESSAVLLWGVVFGAIGFAFLTYGRRQKAPIPLVCGLALMGVPYVISNTLALVLVGLVLMAVPYFVKL